jgi:membrane protein insertase Oxa1/YidC/SpoIIIJ
LFLYTAPSGLTLYIMTSSIVGTLEGRHIRKQVDLMDLDTKPGRAEASTIASRATLADGPRVAKDAQSRAYSKMVDRRKGGQSGKGKGNSKKRR